MQWTAAEATDAKRPSCHRVQPDRRAPWDIAAVDIFRVQDGLIAEHWDVVQPVPERPANPHGMC